MKNYDLIKKIVAEMENDVTKFENGTNAAGSRVRKAVQEMKKAGKGLRDDIQSMKEKRKK